MKTISSKEIVKGNRIIAKYMNITLTGGTVPVFDSPNLKYFRLTTFEQDGLCSYCHNDVDHGHNIKCYVLDDSKLKYHKSWKALMPVIQKINNEKFLNSMKLLLIQRLHTNTAFVNIEQSWLTAIEFIKLIK